MPDSFYCLRTVHKKNSYYAKQGNEPGRNPIKNFCLFHSKVRPEIRVANCLNCAFRREQVFCGLDLPPSNLSWRHRVWWQYRRTKNTLRASVECYLCWGRRQSRKNSTAACWAPRTSKGHIARIQSEVPLLWAAHHLPSSILDPYHADFVQVGQNHPFVWFHRGLDILVTQL
jgi:hypothetical protein